MSNNCRSCQAPIVWAETEGNDKKASRAMPIDADPATGAPALFDDGNLVQIGTTGAGKPRVRYVAAGPGRMRSHFASCPERDNWRKR